LSSSSLFPTSCSSRKVWISRSDRQSRKKNSTERGRCADRFNLRRANGSQYRSPPSYLEHRSIVSKQKKTQPDLIAVSRTDRFLQKYLLVVAKSLHRSCFRKKKGTRLALGAEARRLSGVRRPSDRGSLGRSPDRGGRLASSASSGLFFLGPISS
jgi:hypothetical protein